MGLWRCWRSSPFFACFWDPGGPGSLAKASWRRYAWIPPYMSPWRPLKHQIVSFFMFFDRHFVRPAPQFQRFLLKTNFLTKEVTPLDPSHKFRIKILHKMMCLPAPHHFSWTRSWQKRCFCSKPFYLNFVMDFPLWTALGWVCPTGWVSL